MSTTAKPRRVLLVGASGALGWEILQQLKTKDVTIRTLSRDSSRAQKLRGVADEVVLADATQPKSLQEAFKGVDVVISALGASVGLHLGQRASYFDIDTLANTHLLEAALQAQVPRFIYVAAHKAPGFAQTAYIQAHEAVVESIQQTDLSYTILRPTGVFTAFDDFLTFAKRGLVPMVGDGSHLTNPIHPTDIAEICVANLWDGPKEIPMGGPEIMTRREIVVKAFEAINKKPRIIALPAWYFRINSWLLTWLHPRLSQLMAFVAAVSTHDATAPQIGHRTLSAYYQKLIAT